MPSTYDLPPAHNAQHRFSSNSLEPRREHRRHGSASSHYPALPPTSSSVTDTLGRDHHHLSSSKHRRGEHGMPQSQIIHPLAFPSSNSVVHPGHNSQAFAGRQPNFPMGEELGAQVPRAWSPSSGVRQIDEPSPDYHPQRSHDGRTGLPSPPTGHDLMALFPAHSPAANIQYQPVEEGTIPISSASPSTSTLASSSSDVSKGKMRGGGGTPEPKAMRPVSVPVPGSFYFAKQESAFFSQRNLDTKRSNHAGYSGSGGPTTPTTPSAFQFTPGTVSPPPGVQGPPPRPFSVHPGEIHHERERDRYRRDADGDVRMVNQTPSRPQSTVHGTPPHHHRHDSRHYPHHASPPPLMSSAHHAQSHAPQMAPPLPPHHSRESMSGGDYGRSDEESMRRRSGKHTRRVFVQ